MLISMQIDPTNGAMAGYRRFWALCVSTGAYFPVETKGTFPFKREWVWSNPRKQPEALSVERSGTNTEKTGMTKLLMPACRANSLSLSVLYVVAAAFSPFPGRFGFGAIRMGTYESPVQKI